jgi:hypothetical protein
MLAEFLAEKQAKIFARLLVAFALSVKPTMDFAEQLHETFAQVVQLLLVFNQAMQRLMAFIQVEQFLEVFDLTEQPPEAFNPTEQLIMVFALVMIVPIAFSQNLLTASHPSNLLPFSPLSACQYLA